jgi:mono/diheme cytochrome c family protein
MKKTYRFFTLSPSRPHLQRSISLTIGLLIATFWANSFFSPAPLPTFAQVYASDLPQVHPLPNSITLEAGAKKIQLTLSELKKKLPTQTITLDDPVYKSKKTYDAFKLDDVLKLVNPGTNDTVTNAGSNGSSTTGSSAGAYDEIVFQAADGYAPSISTAKLAGHPAFLAYQEHARPDGKRWETIEQGKTKLTPAPYYLVWKEGEKIGESYPWPYQLVRIELVSFKGKYAKIYPEHAKPDSPEMKGFTLFKDSCIRCHSVNLIGGDIGPELNTPKNVIEYWNEDTLRAFIKNPGTFRAKDKMPAFPQLTNEDLDSIFAYFKYLKEHR